MSIKTHTNDHMPEADAWKYRITSSNTIYSMHSGEPIWHEDYQTVRSTTDAPTDACFAQLQIEGPMNEAIDLKVVHNYGHGGAGVTLHWGCAGDTVALVKRLL